MQVRDDRDNVMQTMAFNELNIMDVFCFANAKKDLCIKGDGAEYFVLTNTDSGTWEYLIAAGVNIRRAVIKLSAELRVKPISYDTDQI